MFNRLASAASLFAAVALSHLSIWSDLHSYIVSPFSFYLHCILYQVKMWQSTWMTPTFWWNWFRCNISLGQSLPPSLFYWESNSSMLWCDCAYLHPAALPLSLAWTPYFPTPLKYFLRNTCVFDQEATLFIHILV